MKVIAIWAQSVDGKLALEPQDTLKWVSKEDQANFKKVTLKGGVIIMGNTTFAIIGKPLPGRLNVVLNPQIKEGLSIEIPDKLAFANMPLAQLIERLNQEGFDTIFIAGGSSVYSQFTEQNLIDEYWITIEPYLFGKGIPTLETQKQYKLSLLEFIKLNDDSCLIKYKTTSRYELQ